MKKYITPLSLVALVTTLPAHAWFKETAMTALNSIKTYPAILSAVGFTAAAASWYKTSQYQKKSHSAAVFINHLDDGEKKLINECIAAPFSRQKAININGKFYDKINDGHMSRLGKAVLNLYIETYNKALAEQERAGEGEVSAEFELAKKDLARFIHFSNNHQEAVAYVQKLEQRSDRYHVLAAVCGIASCIPLIYQFYGRNV